MSQQDDHSDHEHDHEVGEHEHEHGANAGELTAALDGAREGLRSRVANLVEVLREAEVFIPLSEDLPDAPVGEDIPLEGDLTFRPHMILNEDRSIFAVAYSEPELAEPIQTALDWDTSGEELKFICVPSHVAFDLCRSIVEGTSISGLVFNPGTEHELVLLADEAASIGQGTAIPLVGYVADLPPDDDETTTRVQGAEPPPPALLEALEEAKQRVADLVDVEVVTTFNPERDREPHLTITLTIIGRHGLDRQAMADEVMQDAAPHLPAPGYADIVFVDAPN